MAQHFRLTPAARDFGVSDLAALTSDEADKMVQEARWGSTQHQTCPECGAYDIHYRRRQRKGSRRPCSPAAFDPDLPPSSPSAVSVLKAGQPQWQCKFCWKQFTVTANTIFHGTKLSNWQIVSAITLALGTANGMASLELSSHLSLNPITTFLLLHRIREVMAADLGTGQFEGLVQMDAGYFCGKPRKPNRKMHVSKEQRAARYGRNKTKSKRPWKEMGMTEQNYNKRLNKRVVMVITQSGHGKGSGSSRVQVVIAYGETDQVVRALAKKYILPGTEIHTDESGAYNCLDAIYVHLSVSHAVESCTPEGVNDNHAEAFISRLRRAEYGIYHGMRVIHLYLYAAEAAWRHSNRKVAKHELIKKLLRACLLSGPSESFTGYHQGKGRKTEILFDTSF